MNNNQRFFTLYRELENALTGGQYRDLLEAFQALTLHDSRLKSYIDELQNFRSLRNIEAHRADSMEYYEITDQSILLLTTILDLVQHPVHAAQLGVPIERLITAQLHTPIQQVVEWMHTKPYSNIPIMDAKRHLLGVFSDDILLQYYYGQSKRAPLESLTVADLQAYWPIDSHIKETYLFVAKSTTFNALLDIFQHPYRNKKRVAAVFVTHNGLAHEVVLSMITPWDVLSQIKK